MKLSTFQTSKRRGRNSTAIELIDQVLTGRFDDKLWVTPVRITGVSVTHCLHSAPLPSGPGKRHQV